MAEAVERSKMHYQIFNYVIYNFINREQNLKPCKNFIKYLILPSFCMHLFLGKRIIFRYIITALKLFK